MEQQSPVLVATLENTDNEFSSNVAGLLGYPYAHTIVGGPEQAAQYIQAHNLNPRYIILDIGDKKTEIFSELDTLALHCNASAKVLIVGQTNDIHFYRALIDRGVTEYLIKPIDMDHLRQALLKDTAAEGEGGTKIIACMSAAAGDGSSTIATNLAYCYANEHHLPTVLVDLDYQFGMVAKSLDLSSPYGIRELLEHPERGIDSTLVERMLVTYKKNLHVIAAPNDLRFLPNIQPDIIRELIEVLSKDYQYIILDLPHMWAPWISSALTYANHIILVAQLWLKSVMHAARLMNAWRNSGVPHDNITAIINRSGAKFKEAVNPRDFERVCNKPIQYYIPNDIKTIVTAENAGTTILETSKSKLADQIRILCQSMLPEDMDAAKTNNHDAISYNPLKRLL